jgi:hypothetical protein
VSRIAVKSSAASTRIRRAEAWLQSRKPDEELLVIGATLDAANELTRRVAQKKGAEFGWHRLTLPQLALAIAAPVLAARGITPLSRIGADAMVARLVHRMNAEGRLSHYESVQSTPGFPRAVASVIAELRLAHIPPNALADSAPYLAPLVEAYQLELKEAGLTGWAGVLEFATEAASAIGGVKLHLVGLPTLLLDVPISNEAELSFVQSLVSAAPEVLATAPAVDEPTLGSLRDLLGVPVDDLDQETNGDNKASTGARAIENLQRRLFKEGGSLEAKSDHTVEVLSAPGEGRECVEIVRRVLSLARDGVPFDRIAVLLRSPEGYRAYLERLLPARAFRLTTREARCDLILRGGLSAHYSNVRAMACQPKGSPSIFHWVRSRMRRSRARHPRRLRAANAGCPRIGSSLNSLRMGPLSRRDP